MKAFNWRHIMTCSVPLSMIHQHLIRLGGLIKHSLRGLYLGDPGFLSWTE